MSEVIRHFRIKNEPYRKGQQTMDGRDSPFRLPAYPRPTKAPDVVIEGVPPVVKGPRKEDTT